MYTEVTLSTLATLFTRLPTPDSRLPTPDSRLPFPSWEGLGVGSDSRLPTPYSLLPKTWIIPTTIPTTIVTLGRIRN
ncbi:hypothetical protein BJP36_38960 [Moorena producens JHB]|uniref:Uncharacterized protein n=1 Tax=Moorena producens (strain JHB) TaxID=1454205 RepID=A0A9Q9SUS4_MOOP1|nr:hypothetical protein [Moorena producens]WAN70049.1 hypothetical protein BJP36_38960 [Moorena producens JHB]